MDDSIESSVSSVDPFGIRRGVLVAMVSIVPVQNVETPIGSDLLCNRHEPDVVCRQEIRFTEPLIARP